MKLKRHLFKRSRQNFFPFYSQTITKMRKKSAHYFFIGLIVLLQPFYKNHSGGCVILSARLLLKQNKAKALLIQMQGSEFFFTFYKQNNHKIVKKILVTAFLKAMPQLHSTLALLNGVPEWILTWPAHIKTIKISPYNT